MTRICDAITRFVREHPVRAGCAIALTIILAFGVGYTAHFWDKLNLAERVVIPVVGGVGGGIAFLALLKCGYFEVAKLPTLSNEATIPIKVEGVEPAKRKEASQLKDPVQPLSGPLPGVETLLDRRKLHEGYLKSNQGKVYKVKPLKLVRVKKEADLRSIQEELVKWQEIAKKCTASCLAFIDKEPSLIPDEQRKVEEEVSRFCALSTMASSLKNFIRRILQGDLEGEEIHAVYDEEGTLQAVSSSTSILMSECISYIVSAPQNVKSELYLPELSSFKRSEGAAAALIAEAAFKNLKKGSMGTGLQLTAVDSAKPYYRHLGFLPLDGDEHDFILNGDNLIRFLVNYGGRVHPDHILS